MNLFFNIITYPELPTAPRNVSVLSVTNTSAVLSWLSPVDDGGRDRNEIFYTVTANGMHLFLAYLLSMLEVCVFIHHKGSGVSVTVVDTVNVTMAEVTGLTSFSQYTFYVISETAVSSQASNIGGRSSSTSAATPEGGERD